ncbi:MAG: trypsin-like serine protease [Bryobacteraceae bacterium]|jgi:hypothetical protein
MFRSAGLAGLLFLSLFSAPASAIVIASPSYSAAVSGSSPVVDGVDLSGVVELVTDGGVGCSGSLLSDGYSVLTAAHCVTSSYGASLPTSDTATFLGNPIPDPVVAYSVDPAWTGNSTLGGDLAVLRLANPAPVAGYSLYSGMLVTSPVLMAGYGYGGTGSTGGDPTDYPFGTLRAGTNEYVENGSAPALGWSSSLLVGQFYESGYPDTNALGAAIAYASSDEVDISFGDSGGPSFYDGEIIGVHDLLACQSAGQDTPCYTPPSINAADNSYFGEIYADTSVSDNAAWIQAQEVPEPVSSGLLGLGLAILAAIRFRSSAARLRR